MTSNFFVRHKHSIIYGVSLAVLLFMLKWLEFKFVIVNHAFEVYIGAVAVMFTGLGIWLALKLAKPRVRTIVVEREVMIPNRSEFKLNEMELQKLGLSRRELEVLELISQGMSNQEIAEQLFLSLNTIKTHSSRLFEKLEVKSRTQAVDKAKRLSLIA